MELDFKNFNLSWDRDRRTASDTYNQEAKLIVLIVKI